MSELERVKAAFEAIGGTCRTDKAGRTTCEARSGPWSVRVVHQTWAGAELWVCGLVLGAVPAMTTVTQATADEALAWVAEKMRERVKRDVEGLDLVDRLRGEAVSPEQSAESMRRWLASLEVGRG